VEASLWQQYQASDPGKVQVLGVDMFGTSPAMVQTFKNNTGVTFPLLLFGNSAVGTNMFGPYGERDNYVIISQQRRIRYNAQLKYIHGQRFHLAEMQAVIDSLLDEALVGVSGPGSSPRFALEVGPNPFRGSVGIRLVNPSGASQAATVGVYDLAGRRVAELWDGPAAAGVSRIEWRPSAAFPGGIYLVRARIGEVELVRRVARMR